MNQSTTTSCRDSPINAYWNNATDTPDQTPSNAALLPAFIVYIVIGGVTSVINIFCILIFVTKKELRQKYVLATFLAVANLVDTAFMLVAGVVRRHLIFTNQFNQIRSTFECLLLPWPHLQLLGNQLPTLILLVMDIERFVAVYKPVFYKVSINYRSRVLMIIGSCVVVAVSLLVGYFSSYLNRTTCVNGFCNIKYSFGLNYCNYNSAIIILMPVFALILNIFTYFRAKQINEHAHIKRELHLIFVTLIITFVDVMLIACPNIVVLGVNNGFFPIPLSTAVYLYVFYCCNSGINLFVYIWLKRDFRNHLLKLISIGPLKKFINVTDENKIVMITGHVSGHISGHILATSVVAFKRPLSQKLFVQPINTPNLNN